MTVARVKASPQGYARVGVTEDAAEDRPGARDGACQGWL